MDPSSSAPNTERQRPSTQLRPWQQSGSLDCWWSSCEAMRCVASSRTWCAVHSRSPVRSTGSVSHSVTREGNPFPGNRMSTERGGGSCGAITAEWAITLPAVGVTLALVLGAIGVSVDHARLHQAAADGQRLLSFGATSEQITSHVGTILRGAGARVVVSNGPEPHLQCVTVHRPNQGFVASLMALPREATSCGLVVPRP